MLLGLRHRIQKAQQRFLNEIASISSLLIPIYSIKILRAWHPHNGSTTHNGTALYTLYVLISQGSLSTSSSKPIEHTKSKRKNISMEFETWQRLKTFGKFGNSFDDILNSLMNATEEYQSMLNRFMSRQSEIEELNKKLGLTYEIKGKVQEQQQQKRLIASFSKGVIPPLQEGEAELRLWMIGLKFPKTKDELIRFAKIQDQNPAYNAMPEILPIMEELPDKEYNDVSQLEEDIKKIYNANLGIKDDGTYIDLIEIAGCEIRTTPESKKEIAQES